MESRLKVKGKSDNIDIFVGQKLKYYRKFNDYTQESLAKEANVSFQQIQKYENGKNRISASKLYLFSKILNVGVYVFFDGIDNIENVKHDDNQFYYKNSLSKECIQIINLFESISDQKIKKLMVRLIKTFVDMNK
jgi:transcriptional regulator with XRE-family HTH domain